LKVLDEIYKNLLKKDRDKTSFYVTDLGMCPRKVIMNFGDYEKKPLTNGEKLMFYKAENDHQALIRLLDNSENLFVLKGEFNISSGLPNMWRGRLDCLIYDNENKCIFPVDWKGTRSLRYGADLPKPKDVLQIRTYIMALQNMGFPTDYGELVYTDRTGSYEGAEFVVKPDNQLILNEMKIYEEYYKKAIQPKTDDTINTEIIEYNLPPILDREIKQIKNEFYLIPNWQCSYCYYQGISCKPNMSKNKIAETRDDKLVIRKGYEEYEDRLNKLLNLNEDDFYNFCKKVSSK